jgi:hypothetical protein
VKSHLQCLKDSGSTYSTIESPRGCLSALRSAAPQHFSPQSGCAAGHAFTKVFSLAGSELGFVNFPPFCLIVASKTWHVS